MEDENSANSVSIKVYKKNEFKAFLKTIKRGQVAYWYQIAEALGVDKDTIAAWKQTPEAQAAINEGIAHALEKMTEAGEKDWRMWDAKLKLLGLNPATKLEHNITDPIAALLDKFGVTQEVENDRKDNGAIQGPSQSNP